MELCKATIVFDDSKITFEGTAEFVQAQVEKFTERRPTGVVPRNNSNELSTRNSAEKQLVIDKGPRGHHEIVTVLAFALTESGVQEFSEEDVRRAYLRAEVR